MQHSYEDRLRRVIQYIFDNPAEDLSLDALADIAAMSRFHWHRVFTGMTGETCAQAVRRLRAMRASHYLLRSGLSVDEISKACGYDNKQSFVRLFRTQFGTTPAAFRKMGTVGHVELILRDGDEAMFDVEIKDLPAHRLAGLSHQGAYVGIGQAFEQLAVIAGARGLWPQVRGMVGVYYHDPAATAEEDLRSFAGLVLPEPSDIPEGCDELVLSEGRYAVLTFKGPYSGLYDAYQYIFGTWIPQAGHELAEDPSFEIYLNSPRDTGPEDLLTQICVPLRS